MGSILHREFVRIVILSLLRHSVRQLLPEKWVNSPSNYWFTLHCILLSISWTYRQTLTQQMPQFDHNKSLYLSQGQHPNHACPSYSLLHDHIFPAHVYKLMVRIRLLIETRISSTIFLKCLNSDWDARKTYLKPTKWWAKTSNLNLVSGIRGKT